MSSELVAAFWANRPASVNDERIVDMCKQGKSVREIATEMHKAQRDVSRVLAEAEIKGMVEQKQRDVTQAATEARLRQIEARNAMIQDKVLEMYQAGVNLEVIAKECRCGTPTVKKIAARNGLSRRKARGKIYDGPRCARCDYPLDGNQIIDVARAFDVCDDCVLRVQAGEWCEVDELPDDKWRAIHDAKLDEGQVKAVEARIREQLMMAELDAA